MKVERKVLIAYAGESAKSVAASLHGRIAASCQDLALQMELIGLAKETMESAEFIKQCKEADCAVLVETPNDWERKEWRRFLAMSVQLGIRVLRWVRELREIEPGRLRYLRQYREEASVSGGRPPAIYDVADPCEWGAFVELLREEVLRKRPRYHSSKLPPPVPAYTIPRDQLLNQAIQWVLDPDIQSPVALTAAVDGVRGSGASALAALLCQQPEVRRAFPDGIFWVELGAKPDLLQELQELHAAITGEKAQRKPDEFINTVDVVWSLAGGEPNSLRHCGPVGPDGVDCWAGSEESWISEPTHGCLEHRRCLMVIDDVRTYADVVPFLQGGKECVRVATTPHEKVARMMGARTIRLGGMTPAESAQIIQGVGAVRSRTGLPKDSMPPSDFATHDGEDEARWTRLGIRLAHWPVLLGLAGGAVKRSTSLGTSPGNAISCVEQALDRAEIGQVDPSMPATVENALEVLLHFSLEQLGSEDRTRACDMSVFRPRQDVPLRLLGDLWGLDELRTQDLAQQLSQLTLLQWSAPAGHVRLSEWARSFLRKGVADPAAIHKRLVDGWGDLSRLEAPYTWRWVIWHLGQAGRGEQQRQMLLDPDWLKAKLGATDLDTLIADYNLAAKDQLLALVKSALEMSWRCLARDPNQIVPQVVARLVGFDVPEIQTLIDSWTRTQPKPWLRLLHPSFDQARNRLARLIRLADVAHGWGRDPMAISPDGRSVVLKAYRECSEEALPVLRLIDLETGVILGTFGGQPASPEKSTGTAQEQRLEQAHACSAGGEGGQMAAVTAVVIASDGRRMLSSSVDGSLWLWDLESQIPLEVIHVCPCAIKALAATQDGQQAVVACADGLVRSVNLDSGQVIQTYEGCSGEVLALALTPDGRKVVAGGEDHALRVWDFDTGRLRLKLCGHEGSIHALQITSDGCCAVSWSSDDTLRAWNLENGEEIGRLEAGAYGGYPLAALPGGRKLVYSDKSERIYLWDLEDVWKPQAMGHLADYTPALAATPDGMHVLACNWLGLTLWRLDQRWTRRVIDKHPEVGNGEVAVAVTPDGQHALSASTDGRMRRPEWSLKAWEIAGGRQLWSREGIEKRITSVASTPGGDRFLTGIADNTCSMIRTRKWAGGDEVSSLQLMAEQWVVAPDGRWVAAALDDASIEVRWLENGERRLLLPGHQGRIIQLYAFPDSRRILVASRDGEIRHWDIEAGQLLRTMSGQAGLGSYHTAITPDGRLRVSTHEDYTLRDYTLKVWDLTGFREPRTLSGHLDEVWAVHVTEDGRWAVSAAMNGTIRVWDLNTCETRHILRADGATEEQAKGEWATMNYLMFHALAVTNIDGRWQVVFGRSNAEIMTWDLETGSVARVLKGHSESVNYLAVAPNGRILISCTGGAECKAWDLSEGRELWTHPGKVYGVQFSPEGHRMVCAPDGGSIEIRDPRTGELLHSLPREEYEEPFALLADGRVLTSRLASMDHGSTDQVTEWDARKGTILRRRTGIGRRFTTDGSGQRILSSQADHTVRWWDWETGRECLKLSGHSRDISALAVSADGTRAASASADKTVRLWNLASGNEIRMISAAAPNPADPHDWASPVVALTPNGQRILLTCGPPENSGENGSLRVLDWESGRELYRLEVWNWERRHTSIAACGCLFCYNDRNRLNVIELETGQRIASIDLDGDCGACAITPDGRTFVVSSRDGRVHFLRLEGSH